MTDAMSAETFTPHIGAAVTLLDGPTLTLVAVDQRSSQAPSPAGPRAAFSLILRGAPAPSCRKGCIASSSEAAQASTSTLFPSIPVPRPPGLSDRL